jgi:hypothetical protein
MKHFDASADDDEHFIGIVRTIIESSLGTCSPNSLRVIRVNNWFGERWRGFAGKTLGALGVSGGRLRIPPFVPSRVDSEDSWKKSKDTYSREVAFTPLHQRIRSEKNLTRYFDLHCPETIAIWFSSQSKINGRGSIMVYSDIGMNSTASWYVQLAGANSWQPTVMNGITAQEFESFVVLDMPRAESAGSAVA